MQPYFNPNRKTTSKKNGRRPKKMKENGRRPNFFFLNQNNHLKKMEDDLKKKQKKMEDDLKKNEDNQKKMENDLNKNGRRTNQPKST